MVNAAFQAAGFTPMGSVAEPHFHQKIIAITCVNQGRAENNPAYASAQPGSLQSRVAVRWVGASPAEVVTDGPGGMQTGAANGVNADGTVMVGGGYVGTGGFGFRWTSAGGFVVLPGLPGGDTGTDVAGVSANGNIVIGWAALNNSPIPSIRQAAYWSGPNANVVSLGNIYASTYSSEARAASTDGATIVGLTDSPTGRRAFIWDAADGMRDLQTLLSSEGAHLTGWQLTEATGISADGTTLVGNGIDPSGNAEAWIATVPEPVSLSSVFMGTWWLLSRRRTRKITTMKAF